MSWSFTKAMATIMCGRDHQVTCVCEGRLSRSSEESRHKASEVVEAVRRIKCLRERDCRACLQVCNGVQVPPHRETCRTVTEQEGPFRSACQTEIPHQAPID